MVHVAVIKKVLQSHIRPQDLNANNKLIKQHRKKIYTLSTRDCLNSSKIAISMDATPKVVSDQKKTPKDIQIHTSNLGILRLITPSKANTGKTANVGPLMSTRKFCTSEEQKATLLSSKFKYLITNSLYRIKLIKQAHSQSCNKDLLILSFFIEGEGAGRNTGESAFSSKTQMSIPID